MSRIQQQLTEARNRRKQRVRVKISGTAQRPRLTVFRSATHIYAQLIDDVQGKTVAAASDMTLSDATKKEAQTDTRRAKVSSAYLVGTELALEAKKKGITTVVFDRNGFVYTGRIAALADGARAGGLSF